MYGVVGFYRRGLQSSREVTNLIYSGNVLERRVIESESLVREMDQTSWVEYPSTAEHEEFCGNLGGPSPKAKY